VLVGAVDVVGGFDEVPVAVGAVDVVLEDAGGVDAVDAGAPGKHCE